MDTVDGASHLPTGAEWTLAIDSSKGQFPILFESSVQFPCGQGLACSLKRVILEASGDATARADGSR